ncbi:MAG: MarR family transcriptional regulator [Chloroflexota bacterium]
MLVHDDEAAFVEQLGEHLYSRGMQRMPARMWAWLLICDPPEQTAEHLAGELHASRGAISGAARDLATVGLIRRGKRRGERREYFSAPPGSIRRLIIASAAVLAHGREIADEGLALLADRPPAARARLQEFRDAYAYYEREWPRVIERYLEERAERDNGARPAHEGPPAPAEVGAIDSRPTPTISSSGPAGLAGRKPRA